MALLGDGHLYTTNTFFRVLQDPAKFVHWFHGALSIHVPHIVHAPKQWQEEPEDVALIRVKTDLLQALRTDTSNPHALAIFVDKAGYLVGPSDWFMRECAVPVGNIGNAIH